ncbi:MAG: PIN domain-containing protein [Planctomycetes bacterium]|nr:PIN domain-containing protein [Planctomycetota bacterium]
MVALVDTNVLVYRFDRRFPAKQARAAEVLRRGIEDGTLRVPHQAVIEFFAAVTKPLAAGRPLLSLSEAIVETEAILTQFPILQPDDQIVRTALRGVATYGLSWFDAHLWAYADSRGIGVILSEDFQAGRTYGTVRVVNPFAD